jgi:uncharacterized repeat protein (TIGR03803 family)
MKACGIFLLCATSAVALPAQTFTTLHSFNGTDGAEPYAGLVQGTDGNLYGTTQSGGAGSAGNVFNITTSGTLTSLYSFCKQVGCTDGENPEAGLVQGTGGKFYGTTASGGANGDGTVFRITTGGTLKTLHSFNMTDGANLYSGLVLGTNGKFYGTMQYGGANGDGTVFDITAGGTLTTLQSFDGTDGDLPYAELVQGTNGKFYGTTYDGGANGKGTVFSITAGGTLKTLYSFAGGTDGANPRGALVQGIDGDFYGIAYFGGTYSVGTVFKVTPSGKEKTVHSFGRTDGSGDIPALVQGTDGNFYGTSSSGGANGNYGTIFQVTPGGTLTRVYSFCSQPNCTDGYHPEAPLIQDTDGMFYGTTQYGGANTSCNSGMGCGTVFSISVGLGPFVKTQPTVGAVGTAVTILGNNFTSPCTAAFYNNVVASCTWVSASEITTTVPLGATTGTVQVVTTGSGTLSSNVPFTVN